MVDAKETKEMLKRFAWDCYEFWANELDTEDDREVWPKAIKDIEGVGHDPFSPQGDVLDADAKAEFINQLKQDLGIERK